MSSTSSLVSSSFGYNVAQLEQEIKEVKVKISSVENEIANIQQVLLQPDLKDEDKKFYRAKQLALQEKGLPAVQEEKNRLLGLLSAAVDRASAIPIQHAVPRPVKAGDSPNRLYPIFRCTLSNSLTKVTSPDCEVLFDQGTLDCDMLLPTHYAMKLGLQVENRYARPVTGVTGHTTNLLPLIPNVLVEFSLKASEEADAPVKVQCGLINAAVLEDEYMKYKADHSVPASSTSSSETARGKVIIGEGGMNRLDLCYHAGTKTISLMDPPLWPLMI